MEITVFFSSRTLGGTHLGRKGLQPVCSSCDKALGLKVTDSKLADFVPTEDIPLIFSANLAAQHLGIKLESVDINQMTVFQRLKVKLQGIPVPCVKIGKEYITGYPTNDEIVEIYSDIIGKI